MNKYQKERDGMPRQRGLRRGKKTKRKLPQTRGERCSKPGSRTNGIAKARGNKRKGRAALFHTKKRKVPTKARAGHKTPPWPAGKNLSGGVLSISRGGKEEERASK